MRVNDQYLEKLCRQAEYELKHHNSSLCLRDALAIDLRDARARIAELENPGRTQFCLECEQYARRVAELETQLRAAMSMLIDWQAAANGSTHERATLAAKVSDWLLKRCVDGTWQQLQKADALDNQTAAAAAEGEKK